MIILTEFMGSGENDWGIDFSSFLSFFSLPIRIFSPKIEVCLYPSNQRYNEHDLSVKQTVHRCWIVLSSAFSFSVVHVSIIYTLNGLIGCFMRFNVTVAVTACNLQGCSKFSLSLFLYTVALFSGRLPSPPHTSCFVRRLVCVGQLRIDLNNIEQKKNNFSDTKSSMCMCVCVVYTFSQYREFLKWNYGIVYEIIVTHVCQIKWKSCVVKYIYLLYTKEHMKKKYTNVRLLGIVCDSAEIRLLSVKYK